MTNNLRVVRCPRSRARFMRMKVQLREELKLSVMKFTTIQWTKWETISTMTIIHPRNNTSTTMNSLTKSSLKIPKSNNTRRLIGRFIVMLLQESRRSCMLQMSTKRRNSNSKAQSYRLQPISKMIRRLILQYHRQIQMLTNPDKWPLIINQNNSNLRTHKTD